MISPPIYGDHFVCSVFNTAQTALYAEVEINITEGALGNVATRTVGPAQTGHFRFTETVSPGTQSFYCLISWTGKPDDLKASFCGFDDADYLIGRGCMELVPFEPPPAP